MQVENAVIDAGEALANVETTTTTTDSEETITNLKTVAQEVADEPVTEVISEEDIIEETPIKPATTEEPTEEKVVEEEVEEPTKEVEEEEVEEEKETDEDDYAEDIAYIKNNPEAILKLVQDLQNSRFQNKRKIKYDLEVAEKQELEAKVKELQKEKFASKYDDANLPILEEKRWLRRSQNKYYSDTKNEAYKDAYLKRLNEEIEDLQLETKTVAVDNKEKTTPEDKAPTPYQTLGRVWVAITKPRR